MSRMMGFIRRAEQALLQQVGVVSSSYNAHGGFQQDEQRVASVEETAKALSATLSNQLVAARKLAEATKQYVTALSSATFRSTDLLPFVTSCEELEAIVGRPTEYFLKEGLTRVGRVLKACQALRAEFQARKDKVLDHDSYVRRVAQAESALASARDAVSQGEARDSLRKNQVKVRDTGAIIDAMSTGIRGRIEALEADLASAAAENAVALLAAQMHVTAHAADSARVLMPYYPGAGVHAVLLAEGTRKLEKIGGAQAASSGAGAFAQFVQPNVINAGIIASVGRVEGAYTGFALPPQLQAQPHAATGGGDSTGAGAAATAQPPASPSLQPGAPSAVIERKPSIGASLFRAATAPPGTMPHLVPASSSAPARDASGGAAAQSLPLLQQQLVSSAAAASPAAHIAMRAAMMGGGTTHSLADALRLPVGQYGTEGGPAGMEAWPGQGHGLSFTSFHSQAQPSGASSSSEGPKSKAIGTGRRGILRPGLPGPAPHGSSGAGAGAAGVGPDTAAGDDSDVDPVVEGEGEGGGIGGGLGGPEEEDREGESDGEGSGRNTPVQAV